MPSLLQISDPHFGTEQPQVVAALIRLAHALAPDVLLLSGDVTQRARRAQFDAALAFVARLPAVPLVAIPGNHDLPLFNLPVRLVAPYAGWRRAFGRALEPEHEDASLLLVCADATRRWRHVDGTLSSAQIERVARRLEAAKPSQLRVVAVHQPLAVTRPEDEENLLHGRAAALARWAAAGCDVVLGGHIHLPYVVALHERDPTLARRMWAVQAGTALSWRVRAGAPNSVNLLRHGGARRCTVERWDYAAGAGAFERVAVRELGLSAPSGSLRSLG